MIRFSHYFRQAEGEENKGSIKLVIERPGAESMTFCCEDDADDDYDDLRVVLMRFEDGEYAVKVPVLS